MFRSMVTAIVTASMLTLATENAPAARRRPQNQNQNQSTALHKGTLHVQVMTHAGKIARHAMVRLAWRGQGRRHVVSHRVNGSGSTSFSMAAGHYTIRAHGRAGHGGASGAMAGGGGTVVVHLHGGHGHFGYAIAFAYERHHLGARPAHASVDHHHLAHQTIAKPGVSGFTPLKPTSSGPQLHSGAK